MLVRSTTQDTFECITQEHHALLSGRLASAWLPTRLEPLLVHTIGMHDNPWRAVDRDPAFNADTGLPHDFITYPLDDKITFYQKGIDELEPIHPWTAYMISLHYTTFAGTRDVEALNEPEARRRERLETLLNPGFVERAEKAIDWIKFFDVFSLYLCLAGPAARSEDVPDWLRDPADWAEAPDETELELEWLDDERLRIVPWPFAREALPLDLQLLRRLSRRAEDEADFRTLWNDAPTGGRPLTLVREDDEA